MANTKVFVSPGVYTSEVDLSFVASSVGVTTLGIVGETLKGPAFEPIFIANYDEFQTIFGGTSPEKFVNTQIPKYEASYIAKAYLQQSNQLFVSRILGLSGYDAGPSWSIKTIANVDPSTIGVTNISDVGGIDFTADTLTTPYTVAWETSQVPASVQNVWNNVYTKADGSTSTIRQDFDELMNTLVDDAKAQPNPFILTGSSNIYYWGRVTDAKYNSLLAETPSMSAATNIFGVNGIPLSANTLSDSDNDAWYYTLFTNSNGVYTGYAFTLSQDNAYSIQPFGSDYLGKMRVIVTTFTGTSYSNYDNLVVATLRSRGLATYVGDNGPVYEVTGLTQVEMVCSGNYSGVTSNPFSTFKITGTTRNNTTTAIKTNTTRNKTSTT